MRSLFYLEFYLLNFRNIP